MIKKTIFVIFSIIIVYFITSILIGNIHEYYDIDINSGKIRITKYIFKIKLNENIKDSFISNILKIEKLDNPDWKRVFGGGLTHTMYHGAIFQIEDLEKLVKKYNIPNNEAKIFAKELLDAWEKEESYFRAGIVLREIEEKYNK